MEIASVSRRIALLAAVLLQAGVQVQKKIDALGAFVAQREDDAPPLSFVQLSAPDSFADIDAMRER